MNNLPAHMTLAIVLGAAIGCAQVAHWLMVRQITLHHPVKLYSIAGVLGCCAYGLPLCVLTAI